MGVGGSWIVIQDQIVNLGLVTRVYEGEWDDSLYVVTSDGEHMELKFETRLQRENVFKSLKLRLTGEP